MNLVYYYKNLHNSDCIQARVMIFTQYHCFDVRSLHCEFQGSTTNISEVEDWIRIRVARHLLTNISCRVFRLVCQSVRPHEGSEGWGVGGQNKTKSVSPHGDWTLDPRSRDHWVQSPIYHLI